MRPDGTVDTTEIEKKADAVLARESDALLVLRTCQRPPDWWMDAHPDEVMRFDIDPSRVWGAGYRVGSYGSDRWLALMVQDDVTDQVKAGMKVIGIRVGTGLNRTDLP